MFRLSQPMIVRAEPISLRLWLASARAAARIASLASARVASLAAARAASFVATLAAAVFTLLLAPASAQAHEIPERVSLVMLTRAGEDRVQLLLRVPLEAMRDVDFPLRADGTLDLALMAPLLDEAAAVWLVPALHVYRDGERLPPGTVVSRRLTLPSDASLESWDRAFAHVRSGSLSEESRVQWQSLLFDVLLEFPAPGLTASSRLSVEPELAHLGVRTLSVLRFVQADGSERAFTYSGDPGNISLDPAWWQAAGTFLTLGFTHILGGIDHLLFVCCLVIPVRRFRPLVAIVSAFTVAHSITLATAAMGFTPDALWFPPLVETLIAASIVFMAAENVLRPVGTLERRWKLAFAFGLVHGFGFSFALGESLQFAGAHLVMSLAAFNVGVELGQVAVLVAVVPVLSFVFARVTRPFVLTAVMSALVAHTAWHWMTERGAELMLHDLTLAAPTPLFWLALLRFLLLGAVSLAVAWGLSGVFDRLSGRTATDALRTGPETRVGAH